MAEVKITPAGAGSGGRGSSGWGEEVRIKGKRWWDKVGSRSSMLEAGWLWRGSVQPLAVGFGITK